ncbi:MAG: helix-turn-helix domain-containing protein [Candidatus Odinarchaeota archaeon]|nr:helix-turn-helix domain-containing protein [Candidatus Odinarchaeota archaeon]
MTDYRVRMEAVNKLILLKEIFTYRELEKKLGIRTPVLARYVSYKNLPNVKRAQKIISLFNSIGISELIRKKVSFSGDIIDISSVLSDVLLLRWLAEKIDVTADVVLTMAVDGITFGTIVAERLKAKIAYVKDREETGVKSFYQITMTYGPGIHQRKFYLPKKLLKRDDRVLIVDDILRTGKTFEALIKIAEKAKAEIIGGAVIFSKRDIIEDFRKRLPKFYVFYEF